MLLQTRLKNFLILYNILFLMQGSLASSFFSPAGRKLKKAVKEGHSEQVRESLGSGKLTCQQISQISLKKKTETLMTWSIKNGYDNIATLLASHCKNQPGSLLNKPDGVKRVPLQLALTENNARVFSILLKHGADKDCRCTLGMTLAERCLISLKFPLLKILLESGYRPDNLKWVQSIRHLNPENKRRVIRSILKNMENKRGKLPWLNARDTEGNTAVHNAIKAGETELARVLLEDYGADPLIRNHQQHSPLIIAVIKQNVHAVKLILNQGISVKNIFKGQDALAFLLKSGNREIRKILIPPVLEGHPLDKAVRTSADAPKSDEAFAHFFREIFSKDENLGAALLERNFVFLVRHLNSLNQYYYFRSELTARNFELNQSAEKFMIHKANELFLKETFRLLWEEEMQTQRDNQGEASPAEEQTTTCSICLEDTRTCDEETLEHISDCPCVCCKGCFKRYAGFETEQQGTRVIPCPGCRKPVNLLSSDITDLLSEAELRKLIKRYVRIRLAEKKYDFCFNPGCEFAVQNPKSPYLICPVCGFEGCCKCGKDHFGLCADYLKQSRAMEKILAAGRLAPPKGGHPSRTSHPDYYKGRYRPCYYCGTVTERPLNGTRNGGQCNAMVCTNPACGKKWHWNYGDHKLHPHNVQTGSKANMHDFDHMPIQY